MFEVEIFEGRLGRIDQPEWAPLKSLLPELLCGRFMWMNSVELENGTTLEAYKHSDTRRYLWLAGDCSAYECLGDYGYRRMRRVDAIEQAFGTRWVLFTASATEKRALRTLLSDLAKECQEGHLLPASPALPLRFVP